MAFHEQWFSERKQAALRLFVQMAPWQSGAGEYMEIGSWEGRSTIVLAQTIPSSFKLHVVDHWQGDTADPKNPRSRQVAKLAASRDVYADFIENVTQASVLDRLRIHRMDWRDLLKAWTLPLRFVFIDAEHTYKEVADNVNALRPFLVRGAVLCGDDIMVKEVRRAVADVCPGYASKGGLWFWRV